MKSTTRFGFNRLFLPSAAAFLLALLAVGCEKPSVNIPEQITESCNCDVESYRSDSPRTEATGYFEGRKIAYSKVDGLNVWEGDILLTDEQLKAGVSERGTISTISSHVWPGGTLVWKFKNGLDQATKDKWNTAMAHWQSVTNVKFKVRTNEADYVEVYRGTGCSSYIGRIGGRQQLSLASGCSSGNAIHEIGHALGLYHEHTRADRDSYVIVNFANITSGYQNNFVICSNCTANGTLDFGSIMMYPSNAFSSNGLPTITKLDGSTFSAQRTALSANDISIIATKY